MGEICQTDVDNDDTWLNNKLSDILLILCSSVTSKHYDSAFSTVKHVLKSGQLVLQNDFELQIDQSELLPTLNVFYCSQ